MAFQTVQNSMVSGALDPLLAMRYDLQIYLSGVKTANNVLCQPQGGLKKRPGLKFIEDLSDAGGANIAATDNIRVTEFDFGLDIEYLVIVEKDTIHFYQNGVSIDTVVSPYTDAQVAELNFLQAFDKLFIFHQDVETREITRDNPTTFSIALFVFVNQPLHQYAQTKNNGTKDLYIKDDVGRTILYSSVRIAIEDPAGNGIGAKAYAIITAGAVASVVVIDGGEGYKTGTTADAIAMNAGSGATLTVVLASGEVTGITVGGGGSSFDDGEFVSGDEGQFIELDNGMGRARIIEFHDATACTVEVVVPFPSQGLIDSADFFFDRGYENAFSVTRGFPRTGTLFQSRMILGGNTTLPDTIWASKTGLFFDFDNTRPSLDDWGFSFTMAGLSVNRIEAMVPSTVLHILTGEAEFTLTGSPLTPTNAVLRSYDKRGAKAHLKPVVTESAVLYVQRKGNAVREISFNDAENQFQTTNISVLSAHLLDDPVDMTIKQSTSDDEADLVIFVNTDGTAAVLCTMRRQSVTGWTTVDSLGGSGADKIVGVGIEQDDVYFVIKRTINAVVKYYLEKWDKTLNLDSALTGTGGGTTITGLGHLEGETIKVIIDGAVDGDKTVASGIITPDTDPTGLSFEVGMNFLPNIVDLPFFVQKRSGQSFGEKKRIATAKVSVIDTQSVSVNGEDIRFRAMGAPLGDPIPQFTGTKIVQALTGWDDEAKITLSQNAPLDFHIRGFIKEVAF